MSKSNKGFTLIELLVVVGIIAILAIAALIAINPLEAQRRARDSSRLQDMARLQGALEAYVNDEGYAALASTNSGAVQERADQCATNWLGATVNLCNYLKSVPKDPLNGKTFSAISADGVGRIGVTGRYGFAVTAATGQFSFCTYLEAGSSGEVLSSDRDGANNIFDSGPIACTP